ncbi:MAG: hypothetical protein IJ735_06580, partial [Clostridia bacterium]|nr:hypothetical protein [Clostridia bacterium]
MKKYILFAAPIIFFAFCIALALFCPVFDRAYADSVPYVSSATAVDEYSLDETGTAQYTRKDYLSDVGTAYRKDWRVVFNVGQNDYRVTVSVDGGEEIDVTDVTVKEGEEVLYRVNSSGIVTVKAYILSSGVRTGETSFTVRSDENAPSADVLEEMTEWYPVGREYTVKVDLSAFSDDLSGRGRGFYRIGEGAWTEIDNIDAGLLTFPISDVTTMSLLFFDAAGNVTRTERTFDKFDSTPPPAPEVTVTKNVPEQRYARYYTVEADYFPDGQSGLTEPKKYYLNGKEKVYDGPFVLDESKGYLLQFYAEDLVGNRSLTTAEIAAASFDREAPTVSSFTVEIDLRSDPICKVSVSASDALSGVKRVYFRDSGSYLNQVTENGYTTELSCYGIDRLVLVVEDAVQNVTYEYYPLNLFGDREYSDKIHSYANRYAALDKSAYTDKALADIESAYTELNVVCASLASTKTDFDVAAARVDAAFSPDDVVYTIEKEGKYLSGMAECEVTLSDIPGRRIGSAVSVVFRAGEADDSYVSRAEFSTGFTEGFSIRLYSDGREITEDLAHGIRVRLNLPVGYYDRSYCLFSQGGKIAGEVVNNKLDFVLPKGGDCILVVSGSKSATTSREPDSVSVFGRRLSYGAFFGTVFGTIGGAALLIGGILLFVKLRGRRR